MIVPLDLILDFIPVAGWTDDGTALAFAYGRVQDYIDDVVRQDAQNKMMELVG